MESHWGCHVEDNVHANNGMVEATISAHIGNDNQLEAIFVCGISTLNQALRFLGISYGSTNGITALK